MLARSVFACALAVVAVAQYGPPPESRISAPQQQLPTKRYFPAEQELAPAAQAAEQPLTPSQRNQEASRRELPWRGGFARNSQETRRQFEPVLLRQISGPQSPHFQVEATRVTLPDLPKESDRYSDQYRDEQRQVTLLRQALQRERESQLHRTKILQASHDISTAPKQDISVLRGNERFGVLPKSFPLRPVDKIESDQESRIVEERFDPSPIEGRFGERFGTTSKFSSTQPAGRILGSVAPNQETARKAEHDQGFPARFAHLENVDRQDAFVGTQPKLFRSGPTVRALGSESPEKTRDITEFRSQNENDLKPHWEVFHKRERAQPHNQQTATKATNQGRSPGRYAAYGAGDPMSMGLGGPYGSYGAGMGGLGGMGGMGGMYGSPYGGMGLGGMQPYPMGGGYGGYGGLGGMGGMSGLGPYGSSLSGMGLGSSMGLGAGLGTGGLGAGLSPYGLKRK